MYTMITTLQQQKVHVLFVQTADCAQMPLCRVTVDSFFLYLGQDHDRDDNKAAAVQDNSNIHLLVSRSVVIFHDGYQWEVSWPRLRV